MSLTFDDRAARRSVLFQLHSQPLRSTCVADIDSSQTFHRSRASQKLTKNGVL